MTTAILVIDVQNEYFANANGAFPQENAEAATTNIIERIKKAEADGQLVIAVQHFSPEGFPMFKRGTHGAELHASVAELLADKPLVEKMHADSFLNTNLAEILTKHKINSIDICGIMTQNCVTHTAISPAAAPYKIRVLGDSCAAPTELIHQIALIALADRVEVI